MQDKNFIRTLSLVVVLTLILIVSISVIPIHGQEKRVVTWSFCEEPTSLNPNIKVDTFSSYISQHFYERLVCMDSNWELNPDLSLAKSWEVSSDAKTWTFHLRDIKWSDGVDFTSADVKWTMENQLEHKGTGYDRLVNVESIETPDTHTVVLNLKDADSVFDVSLGHMWSFHILPKHIFENLDWMQNDYIDNPKVGTGPGIFVEWAKGDYLIIDWRKDYWGEQPRNDRVIFRFIPSRPTALMALQAGEVDLIESIDTQKELLGVAGKPGITIVEHAAPQLCHVDFNLNREPFDDVRVRKAFAMAIDQEDIVKRVYLDVNAEPCTGTYMHHFPANQWAYNPNALQPAYDPAGAEKLLDEAGYPPGSDGVRLQVHMISPTMMGFSDAVDVIAEHLERVGVIITKEVVEWGTYTDKVLGRRDFQLTLSGGWQGPEPSEFATFVSTTNGEPNFRNCMGYVNDEIEELFKEYRATVTLEGRKDIFFRIQEILAEDLPRYNFAAYKMSLVRRTDTRGGYYDESDWKTSRFYGADCYYKETWTSAADEALMPTWVWVIVPIAIIAIIVSIWLTIRWKRRK